MPAPQEYTKTPSEVLDYQFDFSRWSMLDDDPLASATVAEDGTSGLTFGSPTIDSLGTSVLCRISGGDDDTCHTIKVLGTTTGGQVIQGNLLLTVAEPT